MASIFPTQSVRLPHEILSLVLRHSLAPRWLLSGERHLIPQSLYSTDLHMKLSIVNVCRTWNQVGTELLYETVFLRGIGQLPALVRALENRDGLGLLVRHLDISCMVPRGYALLFESETKKIFELCPRLSHFAFVPIFLIPAVTFSLPPMASSITSLEYTDAVDFSVALPSLVELCGNLRSLTLALPASYNDIDRHLIFPKLEDLRIVDSRHPEPKTPAWKWTMPTLRRMWAASISRVALQALLDAYGRKLAFLSVYNHHAATGSLGKCPALEHLVLGAQVRMTPDLFEKPHPNVKYVDIWHKWDGPRTRVGTDRPTFSSLKAVFPALRTCRYFDATFWHLWDLPVRFPPSDVQPQVEFDDPEESEDSAVAEAEDSQFSFFQSPWLAVILESTDPALLNGRVLPEVDASDDFEADLAYGNESDDYSDTTSDSCDTDSVDLDNNFFTAMRILGRQYLDDEFHAEDDRWDVAREEALEIFSRIVEN
ncbi:hypothetical protein DFH07DRAFT_892459 [Mycena maculata]|uniref:F-box domain-containing protein n=1 Tax=Mycena maculata TaxID=230809 RepID=A0AAD7IB09_9AGAR|nr:hypothetical protein DFH07DRAFT_892459 [Mycena maculata]